MNGYFLVELRTSLASPLRSYTAARILDGKRHAAVEAGEDRITVRNEEKWLRLERDGAIDTWTREDRNRRTLELAEAGTLRSASAEEGMDMAAEQWARELML